MITRDVDPCSRPAHLPSRTWWDRLLRRALQRDDLDVSECRELSADVYRLTLTTAPRRASARRPAEPASVVVKRREPAVAHRERLLARRWLPAVGLADAGPPLLATVCEPEGDAVWSVYEWLDGASLDRTPVDPGNAGRVVEVVASMHVRFASHPLMAEVRHYGAHLGRDAYAGQLDDATLALATARRDPCVRTHLVDAVLTDLEHAVHRAREETPALLALLGKVGGPDTLLHGDLWPKNVMAGPRWLRLIDWERLGVGPAMYDLSALLLRLPPATRRGALDRYLTHIAAAGWPIPTVEEVVFLTTALERARIATLISWRVLDLLQPSAGPAAPWAGDQLRSIRTWWHQIDPSLEEAEVSIH